jgi:hypothetical protein
LARHEPPWMTALKRPSRTLGQASRHHSRCHRLTTCSTVATRGFPALTAVAWPTPLVVWPLNYSLSCVTLRSPLPSAFTMYTSLSRRKAIVRPSGDHVPHTPEKFTRVPARHVLPCESNGPLPLKGHSRTLAHPSVISPGNEPRSEAHTRVRRCGYQAGSERATTTTSIYLAVRAALLRWPSLHGSKERSDWQPATSRRACR